MNSSRSRYKAQQQTISIRVSDSLRQFLERSKHLISGSGGESVSMSEVARILLESAKDDRLDFRFEVAELQQDPTPSLWAIRKKWEMNQTLSRAEWIFLARYIELACEGVSENPQMPRPSSFAVLMEALLAVRGLRADRGAGLDRYYLGNLGAEEAAAFNERQFDPEVGHEMVRKQVQELCKCPHPRKPVFVGRNFYVALRDEMLTDLMALNRVLEPHLPTLFRLAARGHWMREHRPLRVRATDSMWASPIPTRTAGSLRPAAAGAPPDTRRAAAPVPPQPATATPAVSSAAAACCETAPTAVAAARLVQGWVVCFCGSLSVAPRRLNELNRAGRFQVTHACRKDTLLRSSGAYAVSPAATTCGASLVLHAHKITYEIAAG